VCDGLWLVLVWLSPKFHSQVNGVLPVALPVNATVNGARPVVGVPVNEAVGGMLVDPTVTY
jgi:hypothetical protein